MSFGIQLLIELLVAILLAATISYCIMLDRRLKQLRTDEQSMRRTVTDLALATENAERAIATLKKTLDSCDDTLAERLETAERFAADLSGSVKAGEEVVERLRRIVDTAKRAEGEVQPVSPTVSIIASPSQAQQRAMAAAVPVGAATLERPGERLAAAAAAAAALADRARQRAQGNA